jgi:hypothetical protein
MARNDTYEPLTLTYDLKRCNYPTASIVVTTILRLMNSR